MQRPAALIVGASALLALSACSKKTETAATGTAAPANATATATASASAPASAMNLPSRKAGLWEQTLTSDRGEHGGMHQTISMCLDAAFDQKMKVWGSQAGKSNCSEEKISQHLGGGWSFHAVCAMGESGTVTSDGEATGDFGSHYTVNVTSTTSGSPMEQANGTHKMSIEGTWKGPCPADMKAGDMRMPGGMTINMAGGGATVSGMGGKHSYSAADIAKLREQAKAMAAAAKSQQ